MVAQQCSTGSKRRSDNNIVSIKTRASLADQPCDSASFNLNIFNPALQVNLSAMLLDIVFGQSG